MNSPLNILAFGAGAIGAYVGGSLAAQGHRLVFVERPEVAQALSNQGIIIHPGQGPAFTLLPSAFSVKPSLADALAYGPFDVALYALKSFDTPAFLSTLGAPLAMPVLCLSNGVDNEPALESALGPGKVIPGTVTTALGKRGPGEIIVERQRGIGVAGGHPLVPRLVAALNTAGLEARRYPRAADMKWSKLLTNLLANATAAILDLSPAEIFAHPGLYRLEIKQLREALRVMTALGVGVIDLPKTPVRLLALSAWLPLALSRPLLARAVGSGRGAKMPSFHIDLHSGRGQSEVAYLNGAVARYGAQQGIPTPANRLLTDTLLGLTRGDIPLHQYAHQPERLLQQANRRDNTG